ncbi:MAG: hypothetical protein HS116_20170 [Planctomycetes bacterium]|nr:hypothetical protein [Planctomycetota bacterium]
MRIETSTDLPSPPRRSPRGMTLLEVAVAGTILVVAVTATLSMFVTHMRGARLTEERRIAMQFAQSKLDEIRLEIATGSSLELIFQRYGPLDYGALAVTAGGSEVTGGSDETIGAAGSAAYTTGMVTGGVIPPVKGTGAFTQVDAGGYLKHLDAYGQMVGDPATFVVGEDANNNGVMDIGEDLNGNDKLDVYLQAIPGRPLGTVTIITDEDPRESDFGLLYGQPQTSSGRWYENNPFGVDITGNRRFSDFNASAPEVAADPELNLKPFPMDINGDGDTNDLNTVDHLINADASRPNSADQIDEGVHENFRFLPLVVTVQWAAPYGPERMDLFGVVTLEHP